MWEPPFPPLPTPASPCTGVALQAPRSLPREGCWVSSTCRRGEQRQTHLPCCTRCPASLCWLSVLGTKQIELQPSSKTLTQTHETWPSDTSADLRFEPRALLQNPSQKAEESSPLFFKQEHTGKSPAGGHTVVERGRQDLAQTPPSSLLKMNSPEVWEETAGSTVLRAIPVGAQRSGWSSSASCGS